VIPAAVLLAVITQHPVARADQLVTRLASPRYAVREQAAKDLVASGRAGLRAVHRGLTHPDPEVAERTRRLLPLVEAEGIRRRLAHLRAVLVTAPPSPIPAGEPLVRRFLAVTGDTPAARDLYLRMYADHWKVLDAVEMSDPRGAGMAFWEYVDRALQFPDGRTSVDPSVQTYNCPDLALFWFLSADREVAPAACRGFGRPDFPFYAPRHAAGHLDGPGSVPEVRRLFAHWLAGPRNVADPVADDRMVRTGFHLAAVAGLREVRPVALRAALDRKEPAGTRGAALAALQTVGEAGDVARLAGLIADDTEVYQSQPIREPGRKAVLGDLALAACVRLTGQNLADYGFQVPRVADPLDPRPFEFPDDGRRAGARKRWAAWDAARALTPGGRP
jgi:hypothetical protein